jgi:hypothetical protein
MKLLKTLASAVATLPSFLLGLLVLVFLAILGIGTYFAWEFYSDCSKEGKSTLSCIIEEINPLPDSYSRGVGKPLTCADGEDYDAGLCYKPCKEGFTGVGPVCWRTCPRGFIDQGAFCRKQEFGRGIGKPLTCADGEDYDAGLCYQKCPQGFGGVGPVCWKGLQASGRGAGKPVHSCPRGQEKDAGLCYPRCKQGYKGVGPICWPDCPTGFTDIGISCQKPSEGRGVGKPIHTCPKGQEKDAGLCYPPCKDGYKGVGPICWEI